MYFHLIILAFYTVFLASLTTNAIHVSSLNLPFLLKDRNIPVETRTPSVSFVFFVSMKES